MLIESDVNELGNWRPAPTSPHLAVGAVHVWRIAIDHAAPPARYWNILAPDEQARARRFNHPAHEAAYVLAHGAMRTILAAYQHVPPGELRFVTAESGKPALLHTEPRGRLEFSLSHSGNLALLAVARNRAIGIDIERWDPDVDHTHVAESCFSPAERDALRSLAGNPERVVEGFYSAWSRKEAYLKATGHGVSRGLDHFDVSLAPDNRLSSSPIARTETLRRDGRWSRSRRQLVTRQHSLWRRPSETSTFSMRPHPQATMQSTPVRSQRVHPRCSAASRTTSRR